MDKEQGIRNKKQGTMGRDNKTKESNFKGTMEGLEIWYVTGDCCPPPANCLSRCALPGQGYVTVPSVRRGAEPSEGRGGRCKGTASLVQPSAHLAVP